MLSLCGSSIIDGATPFHEACRYGYLSIVKYLIGVLKHRNEAL
jgi:hypothetical protein